MAKIGNKRSPWVACIFILGLIVILCLCGSVLVLGSGTYLYSSGTISINDIIKIVNLGPSELQIVNLSEGDIEVNLIYFDENDGETSHIQSKNLSPYDIKTLRSISPGSYQLEIIVSNGMPSSDVCDLKIKGGSFYSIAVLPEGIIIALDGKKVTSINDVNMATSSLCN